VIFAAPVAAVFVRWRGPRRPADFLLAGSLLASLVYGVVSHVVLPGPDNFGTVPRSAWGLTFAVAGLGIATVEAAGVAVATVDLSRR